MAVDLKGSTEFNDNHKSKSIHATQIYKSTIKWQSPVIGPTLRESILQEQHQR